MTPTRIKLPDTRISLTHKFKIGDLEAFLTIGFYPDTRYPGEIFITVHSDGHTIGGLCRAWATLFSITLQNGVDYEYLCAKFTHSRFAPDGFTGNPDIPIAKSIIDYVARYIVIVCDPAGNPHSQAKVHNTKQKGNIMHEITGYKLNEAGTALVVDCESGPFNKEVNFNDSKRNPGQCVAERQLFNILTAMREQSEKDSELIDLLRAAANMEEVEKPKEDGDAKESTADLPVKEQQLGWFGRLLGLGKQEAPKDATQAGGNETGSNSGTNGD